jgi:hypothetical protein
MFLCEVEIKGISPLSFGRFHNTPKENKERPEDYEKRTWQEKAHFNSKGECFIPLTAFKNCLSEIAKYLSIQIPGKGKSTFTKHFESGIIVEDNLLLNTKKKDLLQEVAFVPSDGRRGGTTRVIKYFPKIEEWSTSANVRILDEVITREIFEQHLREAGIFIGLGRFRPRNNGYFGRFTSKIVSWQKI